MQNTLLAEALAWLAVSVLVVPSATSAQSVASRDEREVRQAVERFLTHLGNHELDEVAEALAPKALVLVCRERDGVFANTSQTGAEWLTALRSNLNPRRFEEPLSNVRVAVDSGQLAYLRADFHVRRDGRVVSSGVDHFTLVREPGGWKIAAIAYTSMLAPSNLRP